MDSHRLGRLDPLTGLRGVAAYSVLIAHATDTSGLPNLTGFIERLAFFGMSLFFVLSGFVIYYNYAENFYQRGFLSAFRQFIVARFARLYPLYAVSLIVYSPIIPLPAFQDYPTVFLAYLTLTQSWFNVEMALFAPDWSVSTEWFFYFGFIPLLFIFRRLTRSPLAVGVYCLLAFIGVGLFMNRYGHPLAALVNRHLFVSDQINADGWRWVTYFAPPTRLVEFIGGMLAARTFLSLSSRRYAVGVVRLVLTAACLWCLAVVFVGKIGGASIFDNIRSNIIFAPALVPLMVCVCLSEGWLSRGLSSRLLVFMGEISYSVYVWSFFALAVTAPSFHAPNEAAQVTVNRLVKLVAVIGITTVIAYGSYLLIEVPARRGLRAILGPRGLQRRAVEPSSGG